MPMHVDITPEQMISAACLLDGRSRRSVRLVCDVLAELGICLVVRPDGGYEFETMINRAKRLVVQELMKCVTK